MDTRPPSGLTLEEFARAFREEAETLRRLQRRLRAAIVRLARLEGWDLQDPRVIEQSLWVELGYEVSEDVLWGVVADAAIDAAYPGRACPERIALGTFAGEAMEASKP